MKKLGLYSVAIVAFSLAAIGCVPAPPPSPPNIETISMNEATGFVGDWCANCAAVGADTTDPDGLTGRVSISISDPSATSEWDGGYRFYGITPKSSNDCRYRILQVRGRATIGATTYRLDWDGNESSGHSRLQVVPGPWDYENGDLPTIVGESITLDWANPTC
jgi:hypothetical protein